MEHEGTKATISAVWQRAVYCTHSCSHIFFRERYEHHRRLSNQHASSDSDASSRTRVRRPLNLALDVVPLAEEREPVIQHLLVLVREVGPLRTALCRIVSTPSFPLLALCAATFAHRDRRGKRDDSPSGFNDDCASAREASLPAKTLYEPSGP